MRQFTLVVLAMVLTACSAAAPTDPHAAIVGLWGDNGSCVAPIDMRADGSFDFGGRIGHWQLEGDQVTMSGPAATQTATITWQDNDHFTLTHPNGSVGRSQRCPK